MTSYLSKNINPKTGKLERCEWLDDYFGRHRYGVRFKDGGVYKSKEIEEQPERCKASGLLLLSKPPQHQCKNCGNTWFENESIPICQKPKQPEKYPLKTGKGIIKGYHDYTQPEKVEGWEIEFDKKFNLTQSVWEGNADIVICDGKPIGMTITEQSKEFDRWLPEFKSIIKQFIQKTLNEAREKQREEILEIINDSDNTIEAYVNIRKLKP